MTTSIAAKAEITTLTAEVRTLVVGSRQITLSVAKQLDSVPLHELTVMGRVRLSAEQHTVIGTATDGSLATASYSPYLRLGKTWGMKLHLEAEHLAGSKVIVCGLDDRYNSAGDRLYTWTDKPYYRRKLGEPSHGREVWISAAATEQCGVEHHRRDEAACDWVFGDSWDAVEAELQSQHQVHHFVVKLHQQAAAAPLIVLAGLR